MCYLFAWGELPCCIITETKRSVVKKLCLINPFLVFFFVSQASLIIRSHTQRAMQKFRWSGCAFVYLSVSLILLNYVCYGFYDIYCCMVAISTLSAYFLAYQLKHMMIFMKISSE
ncbi:hypothetical protein V1520DRAFT_19215 [Lipomyces starkeyi]